MQHDATIFNLTYRTLLYVLHFVNISFVNSKSYGGAIDPQHFSKICCDNFQNFKWRAHFLRSCRYQSCVVEDTMIEVFLST